MQSPHMASQNSMSNSNNMMDGLKSNLMTMMMINNMNGGSNSGNGKSGKQDMFHMVYVFLATSVIDAVFKNAPIFLNFFYKKYMNKIESIKTDMNNKIVDITDNKVKNKTASITITINVNNQDNVFGQAILDYITNNKNTTHVSYVRNNFILNQKDVINIDEDIFAKMSISTATDSANSQMSQSSSSGDTNNSSITQIIEIYSFKLSNDKLREYLENIKQKYMINVKNKLGNKRYFFNMHPINAMMDIEKRKDYSRLPPNMLFTMKQFQTNRKFSNLFGNDIDIIRNRVNFFIKNKAWYDEKGIPYTLGLLLSGNPGTGKTSTIKCLANETNRHICNINLNADISKRQLENLFFNEDIYITNPNTNQTETFSIPLNQRVYVLEDVDCQADIVRERSLKKPAKKDEKEAPPVEDTQKIDLSFLLNLLDGVLENPGRIVIMTSNHPEVLDSALIRPGRIDVIAKFSNCTNETIIKMMEFFYNIQLSEEDLTTIRQLTPEILTPAELSKTMFENFGEYKKSIEQLQMIIKTKEKLKEVAKEVPKEKPTEDPIEKKTVVPPLTLPLSYECDISDDTTEESNEESKEEVAETHPEKPIEENKHQHEYSHLLSFQHKFTDVEFVNNTPIPPETMNGRMQEYAEKALEINIKKYDSIWNAKVSSTVSSADIKQFQGLKQKYIESFQKITNDPLFFKNFTKRLHGLYLKTPEDTKTYRTLRNNMSLLFPYMVDNKETQTSLDSLIRKLETPLNLISIQSRIGNAYNTVENTSMNFASYS